MAEPLVPVEQAAINALAAHLDAGLPDVVVASDWPNPAKPLFDAKTAHGAVTVLAVGARQDELIAPRITEEYVIHDAISAYVDAAIPAASDLATARTLLAALVANYEAHRVSTAAHASADTENAITAPAATDLPTAIDLANDLREQYEEHRLAEAHTTADRANAAPAPAATDLPTLIALVNGMRRILPTHYASRDFLWLIAACRQPVQLDIWAAYPVWRNDIRARLVSLLNVDAAHPSSREPTRNGVLVALGDGWTGTADFLFSSPRVVETGEAEQRAEYRAVYGGTAEFNLTVRAQSARMALIGIRARLAGQLPIPDGAPTATGSVTAAGAVVTP